MCAAGERVTAGRRGSVWRGGGSVCTGERVCIQHVREGVHAGKGVV